MPLRHPFAVALVALTLAIAGWRSLRSGDAPPSSPAEALAASASRPIASPASATTAAMASASPTSEPLAASSAAPPSLAARIDAWSRSGDPHQAMQAYQAVFRCLLARRRAHAADLPPDPPGEAAIAVCGDLRSDQVQQRLAWLETAARAGERGAAEDFIQEGPSGNGALEDLATEDPTPPTADWRARRSAYVDRALANCDTGLAMYLGTLIRQRETRSKAVTQYWLERLSCPGHPAPDHPPLADDPQGQANLDALLINRWPQ